MKVGESVKKSLKKILTGIITISMLFSLSNVTAFASQDYDLDGDGALTISDVTTLQLLLADYGDKCDEGLKTKADINKNNTIDVNDVTTLQIKLSANDKSQSSNNSNKVEKPKDKTKTFILANACNNVDKNYKGTVYKLSKQERAYIEKIVMGEFGTSYSGSVCIAQCIRDALVYGECDDPMDLKKSSAYGGMGYVGYKENVNKEVKDAVSFVFDEGGSAVQHRMYVMCTDDYYYGFPGNWHSTQNFVFQYQNVLFFDYWY